MSSITQNLILQARDQISSALSSVKNSIRGLGQETQATTGRFQAFKDSLSMATGMLMRDFVNSATRSIGESMKLGASVQTLRASFETLVDTTGGTVLSLEKIRKATKGTVSDVELLKQANQAMALGLPTDQLDELFGAAMKLGHAMGISTTHAVESLATGIGRQSRLILDNLGITFKAEDAYRWYADSIGKTVSELDESEQRLAWQSYAIEEVMRRAEELGDIQDEAVSAQERWNASLENFKTAIGGALAPLSGFYGVMQPLLPMVGIMAGQMLPSLITKLYGVAAAGWAAHASLAAIATLGTIVVTIAVAVVATEAFKQLMKVLFPETHELHEREVVGRKPGIETPFGRWSFPWGQFGIPRVPETGLYYLHRGEEVVPARETGKREGLQLREVNITQYNTITNSMDLQRAGEETYRILMRKINDQVR